MTNASRRAATGHGTISIGQSLRTAFGSLRANMLRSLLTALGIIIGTGAVITIIAVTEGNTASITSRLGTLSPNVLIISPQSAVGSGGVRQGAGSAQTLTVDDASAIAAVSHVAAVSPVLNAGGSTQVIFQSQNWNTRVQGVYPNFQQIGSWTMAEGQWFTQQAEDTQAAQAVIGNTVATQLFTPLGIDPIGQHIRISNQDFVVEGVLQSKGAAVFGPSPDDIIYVPLTTVQTRLTGKASAYVNSVEVQVDSTGNVSQAQADITSLLESRHHVSPGADDFTIRSQAQIVSTVQSTANALTLLLVGIAAISLLVGGIGIMNIMLVTVTERTREIGIRVAVGARQRDILAQFLIEAFVLTVFGGVIGIAIGASIGYALALAFSWPFIIDPRAVLLAFGVSGAVGIIFGFYPAQRAARLDPVVALRTE